MGWGLGEPIVDELDPPHPLLLVFPNWGRLKKREEGGGLVGRAHCRRWGCDPVLL